jgi:hypothetical protein
MTVPAVPSLRDRGTPPPAPEDGQTRAALGKGTGREERPLPGSSSASRARHEALAVLDLGCRGTAVGGPPRRGPGALTDQGQDPRDRRTRAWRRGIGGSARGGVGLPRHSVCRLGGRASTSPIGRIPSVRAGPGRPSVRPAPGPEVRSGASFVRPLSRGALGGFVRLALGRETRARGAVSRSRPGPPRRRGGP